MAGNDKESRPLAVAKIHRPTALRKLEDIRQAVEELSGSAQTALSYIERILLDIEFLRENNRAGRSIKGLDERYRRWNVNENFYIVYFVEKLQEEIFILDIRYAGREKMLAPSTLKKYASETRRQD